MKRLKISVSKACQITGCSRQQFYEIHRNQQTSVSFQKKWYDKIESMGINVG